MRVRGVGVLVGETGGVALGSVSGQSRFETPRAVLGDRLTGLYLFLADEGGRLFGDDYFADLYTVSRLGRPTVPARVLATAMVLQAFEGLSDREAVDRLGRDLAWQAAAGVDVGYVAFHSTTLVGLRARLRGSARPKRFLEDTRVMARESGVLRDRVRVLDSTPIYDAVTTEDTITQLRAAIRKTLAALRSDYPGLAVAARAACRRDDDYLSAGRPSCDWDDREAKNCWSTRWSATRSLCLRCSTARSLRARLVTRRSCWLLLLAKTLRRATMAGSGSSAASPGTGSFRRWIPRPVTGTRAGTGVSMATRAMCLSTRTPRSSTT